MMINKRQIHLDFHTSPYITEIGKEFYENQGVAVHRTW